MSFRIGDGFQIMVNRQSNSIMKRGRRLHERECIFIVVTLMEIEPAATELLQDLNRVRLHLPLLLNESKPRRRAGHKDAADQHAMHELK